MKLGVLATLLFAASATTAVAQNLQIQGGTQNLPNLQGSPNRSNTSSVTLPPKNNVTAGQVKAPLARSTTVTVGVRPW
jgi:hypothetical protein